MACRADIKAPDRSAASTMIAPRLIPVISRLRCGKAPAKGLLGDESVVIKTGVTTSLTEKIATENGARLLGFPRIGKIKPQWAADLAIFNINKLQYAGSLSDPLAALVFAGIDHQTEYTIVNGRIVVADGRLTGYDEEKLTREANRIAGDLISNTSI